MEQLVARWAHNPKAGGSNPLPATNETPQRMWGFLMGDNKLYYVYVLYSQRYDKIYIGYTSNLEARLASHNELSKKGWTVRYRPWRLVYKEKYSNKKDAMQREKELKSHRGRDFIRSLI